MMVIVAVIVWLYVIEVYLGNEIDMREKYMWLRIEGKRDEQFALEGWG
jgi:hypothetical protein